MDITGSIREQPSRILRARMRPLHDRVEALFAQFRLARRNSYGEFLCAQYRAVTAIEAGLAAFIELPTWRPRSHLIRMDLEELKLAIPSALTAIPPSTLCAAYGQLYVLEGSRLGARILTCQVSDGLPRYFLSDAHYAGEWKDLLAAIDRHALDRGDDVSGVMVGAEAAFELFARSAIVSMSTRR